MSKDLTSIEKKRHTLSHLMSMAIVERFPSAGLGVGPYIENGWYQDYDLPEPISEKDFEWLEKRMRELIKEDIEFKQETHSLEEAREFVKDDPYKVEIAEDLIKKGETTLSFYRSGNFMNLCAGPHVVRTSEINPDAFKLISLAGAYWRGDEKNKMLTRIYGVGFETKEELTQYLTMQEEAKKRDHRKLGKELELFAVIDEVGAGLPLFYPKGAILRRNVENLIIELQEKRGYVPIWIPHITKGELYEISGHLQKYDAMYPPMQLPEEGEYYLKPMNCPHFMMLYKTKPHSYRELPMRWTCTTTNYRYEKSGELSGLTRVRSLTQDDCHVFMRPDQIESEINLMLDMVQEIYSIFEFNNFWVRISTHDPENKEKYIGEEKIWEDSETSLKKLIENRGWKHEIGVGEAAFYGPKLDFMFKDVIGREWQMTTIQLDMNLPERFELEYNDSDGERKRPIVVHRAILGSTERFLGVLIEHYAGAFPTWLSPVQVAILPVGENFVSFAHELEEKFKAVGIRVEVDESNESVGKKIRSSEAMKIPYMLVVGEKEKSSGNLAVRKRGEKETSELSVEDFMKNILEEIKMRRV